MNYLKPNKSKDLKLKNSKKEFQFNIGLAILRPILAFLVVVTHCYNRNFYQGVLKLLYINSQKIHFHIRIFIIISFYFSYNTLISNDYKKKLKRFERILIPYFLWPTIIYFFNKFLKKFFNIQRNITFTDLKKQFKGGIGFIFSLYFQWSLTFLNIFHILIIELFRKHCIFILIILSIISFNCQYNGVNLLYCIKYKIPLGRTIEFIPCSVIGFIISYLGILNFLKNIN